MRLYRKMLGRSREARATGRFHLSAAYGCPTGAVARLRVHNPRLESISTDLIRRRTGWTMAEPGGHGVMGCAVSVSRRSIHYRDGPWEWSRVCRFATPTDYTRPRPPKLIL